MLKTNNVDYVIASDTDSVYIEMKALVEKIDKCVPEEKVVQIIDQFCENIIQPKLDAWYEELADMMNAYQQKMQMKRETIANKGIWRGKKMYILNAWNVEGVQYVKPKLKLQGIEAIRSSTPYACREKIKEALNIIMNGAESDLQKFICDFRSEFMILPFEQIAFPRGVKGLKDYSDENRIYKKSTPIHVKGSLLYNNLISNNEALSKKYEKINDGDKIRFAYLKEPNPIKDSVIACIDKLPEELELNKYIDRDKQFDKSFLEPIKSIADLINWKAEHLSTLEGFFS